MNMLMGGFKTTYEYRSTDFLCQCSLKRAQSLEIKLYLFLYFVIYKRPTPMLVQTSSFLDPRTVIIPSPSSEIRHCALDPQIADTAGTALLRGSDHSLEDFEYC